MSKHCIGTSFDTLEHMVVETGNSVCTSLNLSKMFLSLLKFLLIFMNTQMK